ncbi:uncharacterized protein [Oscarella lobularis]|uniref:uncharacterized protein n=1 Tax=Oscarella lobularis TaxID=121494 RepID=UPI003313676A
MRMKTTTVLGNVFLISFLGTTFSSSSTPPSSLTDTCKALQTATAASGLTCTTNSDCTSVSCNIKPIPNLPTSVTMSFTLKKCRKPVQLVMNINVPLAGYKYSYTFEGAQTIALPNVPTYLSLLIGTPYVHVQIQGVKGGVQLSAGMWLKRLFSTDYTRYSIIKEQFIPLDVSTCPSIATATLPSKYASFHDYSDDYDSDSIGDVLKKWLGKISNLLPSTTKGPSSPTAGGPTKPPVFGAIPTDIYQLMKLNPSFKMCVDKASQDIFGVTFEQLQGVEKGIIPPGFRVPSDSDDGVDEFTGEVVNCALNYALQGSYSLTENPDVSISVLLDQLADEPQIRTCATQVLEKYNIAADAIPSDVGPDETMSIEQGLLQCFYGQTAVEPTSSSSDVTKWIIIGASVGGAVLIAVIVVIVLFAVYMKRRVPSATGVSYRQLASP